MLVKKSCCRTKTQKRSETKCCLKDLHTKTLKGTPIHEIDMILFCKLGMKNHRISGHGL